MHSLFIELKKHQFLFEELVKRDFKQKYKRTVLGMIWSVLSPLLTLAVMKLVFTYFFGRTINHYTIYLFSGTLVFHFFSESTVAGMNSLMSNAGLFTKINIPKYFFLLSRNVSSLINFALTLCVYFIFVKIDGIPFSFRFFRLIYPIICLCVFNIGVGLILSALFVFFRDTAYLYDIFLKLLMYFSVIFYRVDLISKPAYRKLFYCNPVYCFIFYFRRVVIDNAIMPWSYDLLCAFYAVVALLIGLGMYKKFNKKFLYYI